MSNKIKIDELKLYLGTGLKFKRQELTFEMRGFDRYIDGYDAVLTSTTSHDVNDIKPIVRPMSQLTDQDILKLPPEMMNSLYLMKLYGVTAQNINFGIIHILCERHYDAFGWLDRTGPDGLPLAIEMEEG